jgi:hypothetical protein
LVLALLILFNGCREFCKLPSFLLGRYPDKFLCK